jgi:hypothetical protein
VILIQTGIQLQPRGQESNNLKVVVFSSLIIDSILPQILQIFTADDRQFDFLLQIIRQILQPENSNSIMRYCSCRYRKRQILGIGGRLVVGLVRDPR